MDSPLKDWGTLDPVAIDSGLGDLNLSLDRTTKLSYARVADTHSSPLARRSPGIYGSGMQSMSNDVVDCMP